MHMRSLFNSYYFINWDSFLTYKAKNDHLSVLSWKCHKKKRGQDVWSTTALPDIKETPSPLDLDVL